MLRTVEHNHQITLFLEYCARQAMNKAGLERAAVEFLIELSRLDRCERSLATVLNQLNLQRRSETWLTPQASCAAARERLGALAAGRATVWGHRSHGDFAPWNCAWTAKGFFVFDWEESWIWDIALSNAFYFVVAPEVHVVRSPNSKAAELVVLALAEKVVKEADLPIKDVRIYLALWLLQRVNRQPAPLFERLLERLVASWH